MDKQKEKNRKNKTERRQKKKRNWSKGGWGKLKWVRWGVLLILSMVFFFVSFFWVSGTLIYKITETYAFTADEATTLHLMVLLPASGAYQEISAPEIDWPGTWDLREEGRLQLLQLEAPFQAGETVEAVITYRADLFQGAARWQTEPVHASDLAPSAEVQSAAPELVAQSALLQVDGDEAQTLRQLAAFTAQYLETPPDRDDAADESALAVYRSRVGGSIGRANLLAALSRASSLPATTINGLQLPDSLPLIPVSTVWDHPGQAQVWNEVYYDSAWGLVDPNAPDGFYRPALLGWTDGRHLMYDEVDQEAQTYQTLLDAAEAEGSWSVSSSAPLRFVAWAEADPDQIQLTPKVTINKTWDARWVMWASLIAILLIMNWLMDENPQKERMQSKVL